MRKGETRKKLQKRLQEANKKLTIPKFEPLFVKQIEHQTKRVESLLQAISP